MQGWIIGRANEAFASVSHAKPTLTMTQQHFCITNKIGKPKLI
jgi:hypothetical protein